MCFDVYKIEFMPCMECYITEYYGKKRGCRSVDNWENMCKFAPVFRVKCARSLELTYLLTI